MNKKKSIIITLSLVVILGGCTILYRTLAASYNEQTENEQAVIIPDNFVDEDFIMEENMMDETVSFGELSTEEDETISEEEDELLSDDIVMNEDISNSVSSDSTSVTPTNDITSKPTQEESIKPSGNATTAPSKAPTSEPTKKPSDNSTVTTKPTAKPTVKPTTKPTSTPSVPDNNPSMEEVITPTAKPEYKPTSTPAPTQTPSNVNTAADFTVQTYSGSNVSLSNFFGKPIVINFWASWCGPCKSEMPDFNTVYQEYKDKVVFMMVDMVDGSRETKQSGYNYVSSQGFSFPVYYDVNRSAALAYSINSYPTTYFIDKNGNVATYNKGSMSARTLRSQINKLLY